MSHQIVVRINDRSGTKKHTDYIGWGPRPVWISQLEGTEPLSISLKNNGLPGGGRVVFFPSDNGTPKMESPSDELTGIVLPASQDPEQNWVQFFVAGAFDHHTGKGAVSSADRDTGIGVYHAQSDELLFTKALMVRVRKNANQLSLSERRDFLEAIMLLNTLRDNALPWKNLQDMHVSNSSEEIHGRSCFLPWHRAFLLNLERNIQALEVERPDGSVKTYAHVTLPYWDFFRKAEHLFTPDFLGVPDASGAVQFSADNPLVNWKTNLSGTNVVVPGPKLRRSHKLGNDDNFPWNPSDEESPIFSLGGLSWAWATRTESGTLNDHTDYQSFALGKPGGPPGLEQTPHGAAHVSWGGPITQIGWAPADPLFYLLHCNVDRLWAKWQWITPDYRFNPEHPDSYDRQGNGGSGMAPSPFTKGNFSEDSMWPWDGDDQRPRPNQANWGPLPDSPVVTAPGGQPLIKQMIDYHGQHSQNPDDHLGFDYDDVPLDYPDEIIV